MMRRLSPAGFGQRGLLDRGGLPLALQTAGHERRDFGIGEIAVAVFNAVWAASGSIEVATFAVQALPYVATAAVLGASYVLSSRPDGGGKIAEFSSPLNSQEIKFNVRQPVPSKKIIYGKALVGGALAFEKVKPPYLYHLFLLAARRIDGFEQLRIATDKIAFSTATGSLPVNQILVPLGKLNDDGTVGAVPDYASNLRASLRVGAADQAIDPLLHADFANLDANHRHRGIATMALRYKYPGTNYNDFQAMWGNVQAPNPLVLVRGARIYDPREPGQFMWTDPRDAEEVAAAEATWTWSNNATLVQADYTVQPYGGRIRTDRMRYDEIARAADYDDDLIGTTTSGELIRRHTIDGVVTLNQRPSDVIKGMLTANRGLIVQRAGRAWLTSSRPKTPVLTITDDLLTGGIDFQAQKLTRDQVNRLLSRMVSMEREYQQVDGPALNRVDLQDIDQEILTATLNAPFSLDHRRVQRLQKAYMASSRLGKTLAVKLSLRALALADDELIGNIVNFDSRLFPTANDQYRVLQMGFVDSYAALQLQLAQYDANIERDWNPAVDEKPFTVADLNLS